VGSTVSPSIRLLSRLFAATRRGNFNTFSSQLTRRRVRVFWRRTGDFFFDFVGNAACNQAAATAAERGRRRNFHYITTAHHQAAENMTALIRGGPVALHMDVLVEGPGESKARTAERLCAATQNPRAPPEEIGGPAWAGIDATAGTARARRLTISCESPRRGGRRNTQLAKLKARAKCAGISTGFCSMVRRGATLLGPRQWIQEAV